MFAAVQLHEQLLLQAICSVCVKHGSEQHAVYVGQCSKLRKALRAHSKPSPTFCYGKELLRGHAAHEHNAAICPLLSAAPDPVCYAHCMCCCLSLR